MLTMNFEAGLQSICWVISLDGTCSINSSVYSLHKWMYWFTGTSQCTPRMGSIITVETLLS